MLAAAGGSFGVDGDEEIGEDGEAAGERGEQRGTALPSFWYGELAAGEGSS